MAKCFNCSVCGGEDKQIEKFCTVQAREEDKACWCLCTDCRDDFLSRLPYVVRKES